MSIQGQLDTKEQRNVGLVSITALLFNSVFSLVMNYIIQGIYIA